MSVPGVPDGMNIIIKHPYFDRIAGDLLYARQLSVEVHFVRIVAHEHDLRAFLQFQFSQNRIHALRKITFDLCLELRHSSR